MRNWIAGENACSTRSKPWVAAFACQLCSVFNQTSVALPGGRGSVSRTSATILVPRMDSLKALIREVPDFPKPGINFYDITTLLKNPAGFKGVIDSLAQHYRSTPVDLVLGIEA